RAAGEDLHARAVGALGEHDVVLRRVEPRPDVEPARRGADAAGAEVPLDRRDERRGALPERLAGALEVALPGGRAAQLERRLLERARDVEVLDHARGPQ